MTRLSNAFAKPHPAPVCFVTAGDGDTAANLDTVRCQILRARDNDIFSVAEKLGEDLGLTASFCVTPDAIRGPASSGATPKPAGPRLGARGGRDSPPVSERGF